MTKDTQPTKPSAGALRAARKLNPARLQYGVAFIESQVAAIIDRETGVGELSKAAQGLAEMAVGFADDHRDDYNAATLRTDAYDLLRLLSFDNIQLQDATKKGAVAELLEAAQWTRDTLRAMVSDRMIEKEVRGLLLVRCNKLEQAISKCESGTGSE